MRSVLVRDLFDANGLELNNNKECFLKGEHRVPEPVPELPVTGPQPCTDAEALVIEAVARAVRTTSADAIVIRRLRNNLMQKLFAPDRTFTSWTDLTANN